MGVSSGSTLLDKYPTQHGLIRIFRRKYVGAGTGPRYLPGLYHHVLRGSLRCYGHPRQTQSTGTENVVVYRGYGRTGRRVLLVSILWT